MTKNRVMSLHSSKGLSAKMVVITSCTDELLPGNVNFQSQEEQRKFEEEQRRLFYVAINRCKNEVEVYLGRLLLSSCVHIPGEELLRMGVPSRPGVMRRVRASRFIGQLGQSQPV